MSEGPYYVEKGEEKEGPLDLVTVMRRIRSGKIRPNTSIYVGNETRPIRAERVPELEPFFLRLLEGPQDARAKPAPATLDGILRAGWQFTMEHNIMTVYAGGLLLISMMFVAALTNLFGLMAGGVLAWCVFILMHHFYLIFSLRFFRGQTMGPDFINLQLAPVLASFIIGNVIFALAVALGLTFFIIPGIIVAGLFIFTPFLLLDRQCSLQEAFLESYNMVNKAGMPTLILICMLIALHFLCMVLIVPVPLTLPIFVAAVCEIYEKISG